MLLSANFEQNWCCPLKIGRVQMTFERCPRSKMNSSSVCMSVALYTHLSIQRGLTLSDPYGWLSKNKQSPFVQHLLKTHWVHPKEKRGKNRWQSKEVKDRLHTLYGNTETLSKNRTLTHIPKELPTKDWFKPQQKMQKELKSLVHFQKVFKQTDSVNTECFKRY